MNTLGVANVNEAYYATKTALWCYLLGTWSVSSLGINPSLSGADRAAAERVLEATKAIYTRGMYWDKLVNPKLTAVPDRDEAYLTTINGAQAYQQVFTVNTETWSIEPIHIELAAGAPAGTKIMDLNNNEISSLTVTTAAASGTGFEGQFKVVFPASVGEGQDGTAQINLRSVVVQYEIYYARSLETDKYGTIQDYMLDTDPHVPITANAIARYSSEHTDETELQIIKLEEGTLIPLEGAVFDVFSPDGDRVGRYSTDASGKITIPLVITGNYTVTEVSAPAYHLLPTENTHNITVEHGKTAKLTVTNEPYGSLRVLKRSDMGEGLAGVAIEIRNITTGETRTGRTGPGGVVEFDELSVGAWEVRETAGIPGYVVDTDSIKNVSVVAGECATVTFINRERPGLRIVKYDSQTMRTMPDVTFRIYRDTQLLGEFVTDQMGEIVLTDLEPGVYLAEEIATDPSHIVNSTPQEVKIEAGDGIVELVFLNDQKPGIRLKKVDSVSYQPQANAKFRIEEVGGTFSKEYYTDASGEIDLKDLTPGSYIVTELQAPDGYLIDEASRTIRIEANEQAVFVFTNTRKPSIEIVKFDPQTGKYLSGATFRISKIEDGTHYLDRVTDTNGRIRIDDLEPGVYSVQEMSAPSGYILNDTEFHVELYPGRVSELVVSNEKKPDLQIIKTDAITGRPVEGATFTIRMVDSSTIITETTDANGKILLKEMDPGVYEITEQSVPDEYLLDPIPQQITLFPNRLGIVQFQDYPKPSLTIKKIDSATGEPVEGALFRVTYASNHTFTGELNLIGEYYTDADGFIKVDKLRDGWYRVEELEAPAGYRIKDSGIQECYIAAGRDKVLTFENIPLSTILIRKMDEETGEPLAGAWFRMKYLNDMTSMDGTTIGEWPTDDKGQIEVTGLDEGTYVIDEISAPAGYVLNAANTRTVYLSGENQDFITITYGNQKMGSLLITKKDALTGAPLSGVEFYVCDSDGAVIGNANGKFTTDFAGSVLINNLKPGSTIVVRESRTISGYVLDDTPQSIKIRANETVTLEFRNKPKGTLIVQKIDSATGEPLTGAQFRIVAANGELTADNEGLTSSNGLYTVDRTGQIVLEKLTPGTYVVTETAAPDGYILDPQPQTVVVNAGDTQVLTFANAPKGAIVIQKFVTGTTEPIAGVKFMVTDSTGATVGNTNGVFVTDYDGRIVIPDLVPGTTITARETETVSGFVLDSTPQSAVVKEGEAQAIIFYNAPKGGLIIRKLDAVTGMPLGGAEFKITTIDGTYVDDHEGRLSSKGLYQTDYYGEIWLENLEPDTYVVRETRAPDGYVLGGEEQTVRVNADDMQTLTFYNVPKQTVVIQKYIEGTTKPLAGATFLVTDGAGTPVGSANGEHITDKNGRIVLTGLVPGTTLVVREIKSVKGYELDGTPQVIVVGVNAGEQSSPDLHIIEACNLETSARLLDDSMITIGTGNSLVFYDDPLSTLVIHKYIEGTANEPLAGVAFKVTDGNGGAVGRNDGVWYTNAEGEIIITDLEQGTDITVREVKTVDGFVLDGTPKQVRIKSSEVHELTFWNKRQGALTIRKLDSVTQQPLEGVTFKVTTATGEFVPDKNGKISSNGLYKTDRAGEIVITGVTGTLVVTEVETIPGYVIHEESRSQTVVVNPDDTQVLTFYNDPLQTLTINKYVTGTTTPIKGVTFLVTSSDGQVLGSANGEFVTDSNGRIVISGLKPGTTVTAKELRAADGYVLDSTPKSIEIKSGSAQELTFYNHPTGTLKIIKRDRATNAVLKGAEFEICYANGEYVGNLGGTVTSNGRYVTDERGEIVITGLQPSTIVIRELRAPDGYILDNAPVTVEVGASDTQTIDIYNDATQVLTIQKFIADTTKPIAGVTFLITDSSGAVLGPNNGIYTTDQNGRIVLTGLTPGTTINAKETKTAAGYVLDTTPQSILIKKGEAQTLTFYNSPEGGLEIIKVSAADKTRRLSGVTFEIRRMDDALVDTVTTGDNGRVHVNLDAGDYYALEIETVSGFKLDNTPHYFTVRDGENTTLTIANTPFSGIEIHKIDSVTGKGIYGAKFLLYDGDKKPVGEYVTDQNGYIYIDDLTHDGKYFIRELECEGYVIDTQLKTVMVKAGQVIQIEWKNTPITGQIQIRKYAAEANEITGTPAGAPLKGAVYEITHARSGKVVGQIVTDAHGIAASEPLPLGRYFIEEVSAPAYFRLSGQKMEAEIEYAGQIVKLSDYDKPASIGVTIKKVGNREVQPGTSMRYDFSDIANTSNVALYNFYWHDRIPTDATNTMSLTTGTYNQRLYYRVMYKTNLSDYRVLATNLLTTNNYTLALSATALGLAQGEYVTDFRFEFGTVPSGFASSVKPTLTVMVKAELADGYQIINRADVGGQYLNEWQTAKATWATVVRRYTSPAPLPKTGY